MTDWKAVIAGLCSSRDGRLAEPARKWLDHSFYAVLITLLLPVVTIPVINSITPVPLFAALFIPQVIQAGILVWLLLHDDRHIMPKVKLMLFLPKPFPVLLLIKGLFFLIFSTIILSSAVLNLAKLAGITLPPQPITVFLAKADPVQFIAVVISAVVFAPILEEWAFRRVIFGKLATLLSCPAAMILTSFLFSLMHGNILHAPSLLLMGMILQWVMRRTSSIFCPILIHAMFNLFNLVMILLARNCQGSIY